MKRNETRNSEKKEVQQQWEITGKYNRLYFFLFGPLSYV